MFTSPGRNAERPANFTRQHSPRHRQEGNSTNNTNCRRGSATTSATTLPPPGHKGAGESSPSRRESSPKDRGRHPSRGCGGSRGGSGEDEGEHRRREVGSRGAGSISSTKTAVSSNWISNADPSKQRKKPNSWPRASSPSPSPRSGSSPRSRCEEMLDQSSDQLSLSDSKSLSDSQPEGGVRGNSRRSVLPRPAVRRASAPRSDRAGQPSPAPGSAQNIWQSFSSLAAPAPDSGDAERKEARERSRSAPAPALDVQGILLNAKKGHRSSGLLLRPSPRSLARAARANRHSTPPEGAEHAHAKENGRQSRQDRRGSGAGAEAVAQLALQAQPQACWRPR